MAFYCSFKHEINVHHADNDNVMQTAEGLILRFHRFDHCIVIISILLSNKCSVIILSVKYVAGMDVCFFGGNNAELYVGLKHAEILCKFHVYLMVWKQIFLVFYELQMCCLFKNYNQQLLPLLPINMFSSTKWSIHKVCDFSH